MKNVNTVNCLNCLVDNLAKLFYPINKSSERGKAAERTNIMTKTAQKIQQIVASFDISGERVTRQGVQRRHGAQGYGFYVIVDVAYEGQRALMFKSLRQAQDWAAEMEAAQD